jgi:hypothetical protein
MLCTCSFSRNKRRTTVKGDRSKNEPSKHSLADARISATGQNADFNAAIANPSVP